MKRHLERKEEGPEKKRRRLQKDKLRCIHCTRSVEKACYFCRNAQRHGEERVCRGFTHNAVCGHYVHLECQERAYALPPKYKPSGAAVRRGCSKCSASWISPVNRTLAQLAMAKLADQPDLWVPLIFTSDLPTSVYTMLAGARTGRHAFGDHMPEAPLYALRTFFGRGNAVIGQ